MLKHCQIQLLEIVTSQVGNTLNIASDFIEALFGVFFAFYTLLNKLEK